MKTQNITLSILFLLFVVPTLAQKETSRPVAKEVQNIANRSWLKTEHLLTAASVGLPLRIISKEVQVRGALADAKVTRGNMVSSGYPLWIIQKGVQKHTVQDKKIDEQQPVNNNDIANQE